MKSKQRSWLVGLRAAMGVALLLLWCAHGFGAPFNVRDYGAKGDKTANDTRAIQSAIDTCQRSGGGEVVVAAGNYFCGKIILKSNVTLKLDNGATIWESGDIKDFSANPKAGEHGYLFEATNQENIVVCGDGRIVGTGQGDLGRRETEEKAPMPAHRFGVARLMRCRNVRLRDFQILYSEAHAVVFGQCRDVFVDGVSILNNFLRVNTDGIDPTSCTNVFISNCRISAGDDCICPKTENGVALENLVVENCVLESCAAAVKLGTGSSGDFRDIKVSNCVIRNSGVGLGLFIKDGGTVERVSFANISIETTLPGTPIHPHLRDGIIPIYVDLGKRDPDSPVSRIREVSFSNIQIASDTSVVIQGMTNAPVEDLTLRDITFRVSGAFDFSQRTKREGGRSTYRDENRTLYVRQPAYVTLANVRGLMVDNLRVLCASEIQDQFPRSALALFNVQKGVVKNVWREPVEDSERPPVVMIKNCSQVVMGDGKILTPNTHQ